MPAHAPAVHIVTGIQAAGKSTVAQALAERLPVPTAHVHGDQFRRWIVNGRTEMTPDAGTEAFRQLRLRHLLTARTATTMPRRASPPWRRTSCWATS